MKSTIRPFMVNPQTQVGYLCIANHVLIWMPECTSCLSPMTTMGKVVKESRAQGRSGAETWLGVLAMGVKEDGRKRLGWRVRLCKECYEDARAGREGADG